MIGNIKLDEIPVKPPKKIAIVISGLAPGGAEHSILNILSNISKNNLVTIFVLQNLDIEIDFKESKSANIVRLNAKNIKDFSSFIRLKRMLDSYDLIFAHMIWSQYWSGLMCVIDKSFRNKLTWIEHNVYLNRKNVEWKILSLLGKFVSEVIAVSSEVSDFFCSRTSIKPKVIHNPIVVPKKLIGFSKFNKKYFDIAVYGRLVHQKNPYLAINSFLKFSEHKILRHLPRLIIIGDGPLKEKIFGEFSSHRDIKFLGYNKRDEALKTLAECQIFLSTSKHEGFPLARFEALKLGLCMVSTRTAGYKFLLDHYLSEINMKDIGIFFVSDDSTEISAALRSLQDKKFWTADCIKRRIECTESLSPENISSQLLFELER